MQDSLFFLVKAVSDLYLLTFLIRFILYWIRADRYNPLAHFVATVTNPLIVPARRVLPRAGAIDLPTLVVLILLEGVATWVLLAIAGQSTAIASFLLLVVLRLASLTLWFYSIAILVYVIVSLLGQRDFNPVAAALGEIVAPLLRPARRLLPPIAGWDLSPWLVAVLLWAALLALPLPPFLR
jgi:YggT family protein